MYTDNQGTRWASWNIGVFLCIRCGGLHRTLGTHISKIKSITLDKWTEEQVASMRAKGNARVNGDLNPFPERFPFPSLQSDQQQYIKDKYERKLFSATNAVKSPIMGTSKPILGAERTFTAEIRSLREMGFMDAQACLAALKKTNGNVNQAVDILFAAEEQPLQKVAKEPEQPVLKDDPWSKVVADHKEALNPVSPPPYLEDPFADWK